MRKSSKIEWTEATWNPTIGCDKVSKGCLNCYAEVMARRLQAMGVEGYEDGFKFKMMESRLDIPLKIKKPTKFFVNSMSDLFHEKISINFLDKVFKVISDTPQHTYQILTKREKQLVKYFSKRAVPENVWLGVSVEDKKSKKRIDYLRQIDARIRFLSLEPLLEDLDKLDLTGINWVIVGGESGFNARPMSPEWVSNIKKQCDSQGSLFFFKQWGTWGEDGIKRSKKANGRKFMKEEWNASPPIQVVNP
jgi:protein gp37